MSYELKSVTCGSQISVTETELNIPVANKILYHASEIEGFIAKHSKLVLFIILLLDLNHANIDQILIQLSEQTNVLAILICGNCTSNSSNSQRNILRISRHLITNEFTFRAIRAYESTSHELHLSGPKDVAIVLEEKAKDLKRWFTTNNKVKYCHIIIIPLNTTDHNLIDFQQHVIDCCKRFYPNKDIIVYTIYDFITLEESNFNDLDVSNDLTFRFQHEQRKIVCNRMTELPCIRMYLVGNESRTTNYWSRLLIAKELDNGSDNIFEYAQRCTFVENEPVVNEIRKNVAGYLGCHWQVTKTEPMRLYDIERDNNFHNALLYVHDNFEILEKEANLNLYRQLINYRENASDHTSEYRSIGQAEHGPVDQDRDFSESMDTKMLPNYQESDSN